MKTSLKICKASAGSGKTFTLAVEYIKHIVRDPSSYRRILAVTFTNKATAEMKERILSQLYGLSRSLKDSDDYMLEICSDEGIKNWYAKYVERQKSEGKAVSSLEECVRKSCRMSLNMIIHDYQRFRIETIDSFFQTIIRELAHDLNLTANLKVELNNDEALHEGVAKVIDAIPVDRDVRNRVYIFVQRRMDENKNWAVSADLEKFGKNIFNENFLKYGKELREKLKDPDFLPSFRKTMLAVKKSALKAVNDVGQEFLDKCMLHGLTVDDFKSKSRGIYPFFQKLAETDVDSPSLPNVSNIVLAFTQSPGAWSSDANVISVVEKEDFVNLLIRGLKILDDSKKIVNTVSGIERHINNLSLINTISSNVNDVVGERCEFLLANTNHFLNEMISESDVPFIYERTGSRFEHIMIDEFQDTSVLQWENFKPLIKNSLDTGNQCLIVGDVKQSIYRWRNGEWSILNNMSDDPDFHEYVESSPLGTNHRSEANIISFNNEFFDNASGTLSDIYAKNVSGDPQSITNAYNGCRQEIPEKRKPYKGYVRVEMKSRNKDGDKEDASQWQCQAIAENVRRLISAGVPQSQICILVRKNASIPLICDYFDKEVGEIEGISVKVVSSEAYRLDMSPVVRLIVVALRMIQNTDDKLTQALLVYHYKTYVEHDSEYSDLNKLFLSEKDDLMKLLPAELQGDLHQLSLTPLYELCERLYTILGLNKVEGQDSYLFTFYDYVNDFLTSNNTDTESFLRHWDEELSSKTVNDGCADGIRIMTIHKSKGLEFHSVIVPFANWGVQSSANNAPLMWCHPSEPPFDELPLCPVNANKSAGESLFADEYKEEILKENVDNLNILYVAMTRASKNLIVLSDEPSVSPSIYNVIDSSMPKMMCETDNNGARVFEYGAIVPYADRDRHSDNVFLSDRRQEQVLFASGDKRAEFRQSNKSRHFIEAMDSDSPEVRYRNEGILFHKILESINTLDDIGRAVRQLDFDGCFADANHRDDVSHLVRHAFENPVCREWFDPHWTVINENNIVWKDSDGHLRSGRSDRVITDGVRTIVIDYKTGQHNSDHEVQVRQYVTLLTQMGYPDVTGYIWYIRRQRIVKI